MNCRVNCSLFGKTDSLCFAAWALQRTAIDNQTEFTKEGCDIVSKKLHVDDYLFCLPTTKRAIKASLQLMKLFKKATLA